MAEQKIKDWRRAAKATIHKYPEIKQKTKDATNSDLWGPTDAQKSEIAEAAFNDENRQIIFKALWKRIVETDEYWMHVWKALDVLEYLLLVDVPGIVNELRFHSEMISHLVLYAHAKHKDSKEQDALNDKVRYKAKKLINLLEDAELLQSERQKLRLIMARLTGVADPQLAASLSTAIASGGHAEPLHGTRPVPLATGQTHPHVQAVPATGGSRPPLGGGRPGERSPPSPQGAGQEFELDMNVFQQMMEMGFTDQDAVIQALLAADNNLDRACEYILRNEQQGGGGRKPSPVPPKVPNNSLIANPTYPAKNAPVVPQPVSSSAGSPQGVPPRPSPQTPSQPQPDLWSVDQQATQDPPTRSATSLFDDIGNPALNRPLGGTAYPPTSQPPVVSPTYGNPQPAPVAAPNFWPSSQPTAPAVQTPPQQQAANNRASFDPFADAVNEHLVRPTGQPSPPPPTATNVNFFEDPSARPPQQQQRKAPSPPPSGAPTATAPNPFDDLFATPGQGRPSGGGTAAPTYSTPTGTNYVGSSPSGGNSPPQGQAGGLSSGRPSEGGNSSKPVSLQDKMLQEFHTMGQPKPKKEQETLGQLTRHY